MGELKSRYVKDICVRVCERICATWRAPPAQKRILRSSREKKLFMNSSVDEDECQETAGFSHCFWDNDTSL